MLKRFESQLDIQFKIQKIPYAHVSEVTNIPGDEILYQ